MKKKELYILTGFLGAGKTSLLLHLLDHITDRKIGIIQNEFGKLSVDGERIQRGGITMTEITRGSIFCSCLKLTFAQSLAEMGKMDLDVVFVESSGLADPSNMEEILKAVRVMAGDVYEFRGAICLIDAVNFPEQVEKEETVRRQLLHCHMAVINKVDLISAEELESLTALIRSRNPKCKLVTCTNGQVDLSFLGENLIALRWMEDEACTNSVDNKPKTFSMECTEPISRQVFQDFLQTVLPDCYRIKGVFLLEDGWHQVDVVEKLIDLQPCGAQDISHIVFLTKIGPKMIRVVDTAWKEIVGKPMKLKN